MYQRSNKSRPVGLRISKRLYSENLWLGIKRNLLHLVSNFSYTIILGIDVKMY